jgi:uncharacterized membrane protein YoaK (UPF0700 family)
MITISRDDTGMTENASGAAAADGRRHAAARDVRVVLLTMTTGAVDAVTFLLLGKVFASVITGNLVVLGVSAATRSPSEALHSGVALASYAAGVAVGAPLAARGEDHDATWPRSVTVTLAAELCVLAAFCAGWELASGRPRDGGQLVLLVLAASAMGMQSAATRRLGQMSSTYLTSTLTVVVAALATGKRPEAMGRSLGAIAAIVVGAVAGGLLAEQAHAWLPAMVLLPLGLVVAGRLTGLDEALGP